MYACSISDWFPFSSRTAKNFNFSPRDLLGSWDTIHFQGGGHKKNVLDSFQWKSEPPWNILKIHSCFNFYYCKSSSKTVSSRVWKQLSIGNLLSWCGGQTSWSLEPGEMPPAASWRASWSPGPAEAHSPRRGPPPASGCSASTSVLSQNWPTSKPQPQPQFLGGSQSSQAKPHFHHGVSFQKTLTNSHHLWRYPDNLTAWTQLSLALTRQLFSTSPSTKCRYKDSPMDGTVTWRN